MTSSKEDREAKRARARAMHSELADWRSPGDFSARVGRLNADVPSRALLRSRDFNFLTEALALAEFVMLRPVDEVRLNQPDAQHPDAYVRIGAEVIEVEITEALNDGRRRGDEYHEDAPKLTHVNEAEMEARRADLEPAITAAISNKVDRGNHSGILLVYVELQIHFELTPEEEAAITAIKRSFREKFRDIFVLCKGKLY